MKNTLESCHFVIRYWGQDGSSVHPTSQAILASRFNEAENSNDEGFMGLMDFNSLVLPTENHFLRALATQKQCKPAEEISNKVETSLAKILQLEINFFKTFERMKVELEQMAGFSTQKLFNLLDKKNFKFLDMSQINFFMEQVAKANPDMRGLDPNPKWMAALFRRISNKVNSKLSYQDFARFLQPTDLKPYLERIKKKTKLERKHFENAKLSSLESLIHTKEKDRRKPLTAFKSEVMLKKVNSKEVFVS